MSLTSALNIAQSALFNTSRQTGVVSRNISEASNPDYARRSAVTTTTGPGARIAEIRRATNEILFRQNMQALSAQAGQSTVSDGLDALQLTVNGVDNAGSAATALADFQAQLQLYASAPSNSTLGATTVESARQVVRSLNQGAAAIQTFRADTDKQIAAAVDDLNGLLARFQEVNKEIVAGTRAGRDVSDALDQRDATLKQISQYVSVSTIARDDNDMVIMTADGATLFETVARPVTFEPTSSYAAGLSGNAVYIDGVPMKAGTGGNTSAQGSIAAQLQLRDDVAVDMQKQLDEVARGLVTAFAETDPSGTGSDVAGLFTWAGGTAIPASGTLVPNMASLLQINAAFDDTVGGDPTKLRDGAAYTHNTNGAASFSDLLRGYGEKLDGSMDFDPAAGLEASATLGDFASDAIGWLGAMRQDASRGSETKDAFAARTQSSLSNATGVNVDEEMATLLDLEHAYQASARIIRTVDDMLTTLMQAAG